MIMISVCLPSDALSQHLPSYLGFSYIGSGVSLHGCSINVQPLLLTLDEVNPPDLECGVAPLGPPAPAQPPLLGRGVAPPGRACAPSQPLQSLVIFRTVLPSENVVQEEGPQAKTKPLHSG